MPLHNPCRWSPGFSRFWLALLLIPAVGCGSSHSPEASPASSPPPTTVQVVTPQMRTITRTISEPGSIQAFEQTAIFAKVPGYVSKWCADIGDEVHKDELLAQLWVPEMISELNIKKEQVEQAKKALAMAQAEVVTAKAQVKEAEAALMRAEAVTAYWKSQSERFTGLVTQSVLDKQSQEETQNQYKSAAASMTEAQAKIASATALAQAKGAALGKSEADIRAAQADEQRQADLASYATFKVPYDGVVTRRNINTWDFVQPPTGGKGEPLYVVERRDIMRVFVDVPETEVIWVTKGAPARVRVGALQGKEFSGKVARTSYSLDRTTRTLLAEIDLPNPQDQLRPGMYAYATIEGQSGDVLTLPSSAIVTEGDVNVGYQTYCFLVEDGRVKRTPIEIGTRNSQLVEVLRKRVPAPSSGESPGWQSFTGTETVVRGDLSGLKDGQAVERAAPRK